MNKCWCGGATLAGDPEVCLESVYHKANATGETPLAQVTRLYIAGPMTGYPECNYPAFHAAERQLLDLGYAVVNPAARVDSTKARHYVDLLRDDLRLMLDCQGVALLPGWEFSIGARNEAMVAGTIRMHVRTLSEWLST